LQPEVGRIAFGYMPRRYGRPTPATAGILVLHVAGCIHVRLHYSLQIAYVCAFEAHLVCTSY